MEAAVEAAAVAEVAVEVEAEVEADERQPATKSKTILVSVSESTPC